ncbi:MAG: triose-phosphate isomerase [Flavobacteriales bacterium]|nr:triose-phosphate isomerase [Flavobacteriales bacterium]
MRTILAGNWKMNKDATEARALLTAVMGRSCKAPTGVEVVVAPPFPYLAMAVELAAVARDCGVVAKVAAQNCHHKENGAYTGEVSVPMLRSLGVDACLVAHSERRQYFGETYALAADKIHLLLQYGMEPILCCGEGQEERENGSFNAVVERQLRGALATVDRKDYARLVVAYEPVWAIGTGLTATPQQAQDMHAHIRGTLVRIGGEAAREVPVLYGGSCKPDNAEGLFNMPDINGGLIGGASLEADQFLALITAAGRAKQP